MNDMLVRANGAIKETWTKSIDFLIKCGGEWLKPRTFFALMFYFAYIKLTLGGVKIPDGLELIVGTLLGYYFGSKGLNRSKENGSPKP